MDLIKEIQDLLHKYNISIITISRETGVPDSNLYLLRNGKRKIERLELETANKLLNYKWKLDHESKTK